VTIYSITLPSYALSPTPSKERVITPLDASRIVAATGGRDFPADARDFTPVFKALAEEIRASYALSYYPDLRDGKYHELRVATTRSGVASLTTMPMVSFRPGLICVRCGVLTPGGYRTVTRRFRSPSGAVGPTVARSGRAGYEIHAGNSKGAR